MITASLILSDIPIKLTSLNMYIMVILFKCDSKHLLTAPLTLAISASLRCCPRQIHTHTHAHTHTLIYLTAKLTEWELPHQGSYDNSLVKGRYLKKIKYLPQYPIDTQCPSRLPLHSNA